MKKEMITAKVQMDYKTLRAFSLFDTFLLKKHWVKPTFFGGAFVIFAIICFAAVDKEQNWLLGLVMLAIGLGMPAVYVGMFLSQVKAQAKKLRLDPPRRVYTLEISDECIVVTNDIKAEEKVTLEWQKLPAAFRRKDAIYLYVTSNRAFILPDGQADSSADELWAMMQRNLREGRAISKR